MSDYDPRLVALYDDDNPDGPDHDFYRALADRLDAHSILDLGCGTGMLTASLTQSGRTVVGVDPSANMIDYARTRRGGTGVVWRVGDSRDAPPGPFDLAVMTGNVAQHIGDADWRRTLTDLHSRIRVGGTLAFESRNPAVRAWEAWSAAAPTTRATAHGTLTEWMESSECAPGVVELLSHNAFVDTGEEVTERLMLHFRWPDAVIGQLKDAGFELDGIYGGWSTQPLTPTSSVMVFVAVRA